MNIFYSKEFQKNFRRITKYNRALINKIKNQLTLLQVIPQHPFLKLHKLKGRLVNCFSISIASDLHIVFIYVDGNILLVDIGTHDQVYR